MPVSVLYIFDDSPDTLRLHRYCSKLGANAIFLCPITTNQDVISETLAYFSSMNNYRVTVIPYLEQFHRNAISERDNFINFISKFSASPIFAKLSIKEYFKFLNGDFSAWWLSLLAEKNPIKSQSYNNLVKLLTILKLKKEYSCKNIVVDLKSRELSGGIRDNSPGTENACKDFNADKKYFFFFSFLINFLKGLYLYSYFIYKIFILSVNLRKSHFRKSVLKNAKYLAITYFPHIDGGALKGNKFVNKYYGLLQEALEHKHKNELVWLAFFANDDNFKFKESVKLAKSLNFYGYPIYFIEEWIFIRDLISVLFHYLYFATKFLVKIPILTKKFVYSQESVNLWSLFEKDWLSSFSGQTLMEGVFYYKAFRRLSDKLRNGTKIIYLAENLAWEKALNFIFHKKNKFKVIGMLHTSIPLLFLPYFETEYNKGDSKAENRGQLEPDYFLCNGKTPLELFKGSHGDNSKILPWFAIRYQYLKDYLNKNTRWNSRENKILVALSLNKIESQEMLYYIYQAFKNKAGYQIIIREHYSLSARTMINNLNFNEGFFTINNDESLGAILQTVKAMIVAGSSAAFAGIASRCPVIIPKLSSVIDMNPLAGVSDLPIYADSPKELRRIVDDIMSCRESPLPEDKCRSFIESYFNFSNSENELLDKLYSLN